MYNLDKVKRARWQATLQSIAALPIEQRPAMCKRRISGRQWTASNSMEVERRIFDAVMALRHRRLPVSIKQLRALALLQHGVAATFKASAKFALSFMRRWRLSWRARTTTKDVGSAKVLDTALRWQAQFWKKKCNPAGGQWIDLTDLWNMDETAVYLDMPPGKTLHLVGAKSVEIATTQHDYTRVAVVLCCSASGVMLDPLVIHKCSKQTRRQNEVRRVVVTAENGNEACMYVTKNESGWLNGALMQLWVRDIFAPAMQRHGRSLHRQCLLMDNCSVHTTADVWDAVEKAGFQVRFFPPNCTPILQPCDMNINRDFKRVWTARWLDWFIEYGSTPANWTPHENARKAGDDTVHAWVASCMQAMTAKVVRASWERSVFARWWCAVLDRTVYELVALYVAAEGSDEWQACWHVWELCAQLQASDGYGGVAETRVSGRTRKKGESKEEHDRRLEGYAEMERRAREKYDAPLAYDSDEDEVDEKELLYAEQLVEQLTEGGEVDANGDEEREDDKENRPPKAARTLPWEGAWAEVQRMAEEAQQRKGQRL